MEKRIYHSVSFGFFSFIIAFVLGSILTYSTGIPLIGGLLNGVLTAMVLSIGLISKKFWGNGILIWLVFSLFASITATLGPPGIYKVAIGFLAGLIWDTVYKIANFKKWGLFLGGMLGSASIFISIIFALKLGFGKNAVVALRKYTDAFWILLAMNLIITFIGLLLGNILYESRLKNFKSFKNL